MKNIIYATKDLFRNYFKVSGRLSRAGYWWAMLGYLIIDIICVIIGALMDTQLPSSICSLVFFIPMMTAAIRRFHDCGRSTGFYVILVVLDFVFLILIFGAMFMTAVGAIAESVGMFGGSLIGIAVGIIGSIVCFVVSFIGLVKASDPGENKWGAPVPFDPDENKDENEVI